VNRTWRRILTAKALALSALIFAALVATVLSRRRQQLDADSSWHPGHEGYPPHVKPDR